MNNKIANKLTRFARIDRKNEQFLEIKQLAREAFVGHNLGTQFFDTEILFIPENPNKRKASDDVDNSYESETKRRRIE